MPILPEDFVFIIDEAVKLYRCERSRKWYATFETDAQYIRISTGKSDLEKVKQAVSDGYLEYSFCRKNDVPVVCNHFSDVVKLCN
tara:strand:+ start:73 stop:327 length:255 start_codon:yes stop_codon:yes gene_type:complete